jgi:hypothetical protein
MSVPPRTIRYLAAYGAKALQASFNKGDHHFTYLLFNNKYFYVNVGKYFGPLVPKRKASVIRKQAIKEGLYGSFDPVKGCGWDAKWDELKVKKMYFLKPHKGHLRERTRPERAAKITKAMEGMPARLAKYKQEIKDRRPKKDIMFMFERAARLSKVKTQENQMGGGSVRAPPRSKGGKK